MGRHKLRYKLKKPNKHHKYWRYVLSTDPKQSEISARTKVKYEAERIAKEAYIKSMEDLEQCITFGRYAENFYTEDKCKLTIRKKASNKPFTPEMLVRRGQLVNYLMKGFKYVKLDELDLVEFEEWRLKLPLANSTKNGITVTMKQNLNEAVREKIITQNPLLQVDFFQKSQPIPEIL